jgi:hypothetical protein
LRSVMGNFVLQSNLTLCNTKCKEKTFNVIVGNSLTPEFEPPSLSGDTGPDCVA